MFGLFAGEHLQQSGWSECTGGYMRQYPTSWPTFQGDEKTQQLSIIDLEFNAFRCCAANNNHSLPERHNALETAKRMPDCPEFAVDANTLKPFSTKPRDC